MANRSSSELEFFTSACRSAVGVIITVSHVFKNWVSGRLGIRSPAESYQRFYTNWLLFRFAFSIKEVELGIRTGQPGVSTMRLDGISCHLSGA